MLFPELVIELLDPRPGVLDVQLPIPGTFHRVDHAPLIASGGVPVADHQQVLGLVGDVPADAEELLGDLHGVDASQGHDHRLALALEGQRSKVRNTKW